MTSSLTALEPNAAEVLWIHRSSKSKGDAHQAKVCGVPTTAPSPVS